MVYILNWGFCVYICFQPQFLHDRLNSYLHSEEQGNNNAASSGAQLNGDQAPQGPAVDESKRWKQMRHGSQKDSIFYLTEKKLENRNSILGFNFNDQQNVQMTNEYFSYFYTLLHESGSIMFYICPSVSAFSTLICVSFFFFLFLH